MFIDHHCHLDFPQFAEDFDGVIQRAKNAGVGAMVTISTHVKKLNTLLELTTRDPDLYCSVGTHPHNADQEMDITIDDLVRLANSHNKIVAIGEAGLDYFYQKSTRENQAEGFRRHIAAARITGLPLEIHTRDADDDCKAILEEEHARGAFPAILHCYTGGMDLAMRAVELGLYVSFTGVVSFKKSDALREIAKAVPLDRILIETDAPYLSPEPHRGKTNEPAFVVHTAAAIAKARGLTTDQIAAATTQNFFRLFTKVKRPAEIFGENTGAAEVGGSSA
ncbi:MAG: TatD family hydrolase [Hyphomicrobiaceae bacterium]